jgi:hypothetical protein
MNLGAVQSHPFAQIDEAGELVLLLRGQQAIVIAVHELLKSMVKLRWESK